MTNVARHQIPSFDGTPISYLDSGTGNPVALLLHGFLIDAESNFGPADRILGFMAAVTPPGSPVPAVNPAGRAGVAARLLAAGFRVVMPDMRGHGQSGKPATVAGYQHRAMARDMITLLDHLGIDRCDILGYSMGSVTAAHLIAEAPARVQSAIFGGMGGAMVAGEPMVLPPELPVPASVPQPLTFAAFAEYAAAVVDGSAPAEGVGAMYALLADRFGVDRQVAAAVLRGQLADAVAPAALRAFPRPVLVLNGDQDAGAVPGEAALGKYLTHGSFVRCQGDHLTAVFDPGFQTAVVRHFQGVGR